MASTLSVTLCGFLLLSTFCKLTQAKGFLGRLDQVESLLGNVKDLLGGDHYVFTKKKIGKIESVLRPIFMAMHKNKNGKLEHAAASFALHRLFVHRHGWYVTGLEPEGKGFMAWSSASPATVLQKHMPASAVSSLEKQLFHDGFGLHELAIVAATIEHFVHIEEMERLQSAFQGHHMTSNDVLKIGDTDHVLDSYMALYLVGSLVKTGSTPSEARLHELLTAMPEIYPGWSQTQEFVHDVRQSIFPKSKALSFNDVTRVVEETSERYGRFQDTECRSITAQLLAVEDKSAGGAGRVRLADFYGVALKGQKFQFTESASLLRKLGALDETDPQNPRVIIPNYVYGSSNCVASSRYYEVCCINQCEDLVGHLEDKIAAPDAKPKEITAIVASLESPSLPNGKVISPWLLQKLQDIAEHHHGSVPLHGRLFAQWMHFAYPRECPYPQLSGESSLTRIAGLIEDKQALKGAIATEEEMRLIVSAAGPPTEHILDASAHEALSLWSEREELVV